MKKRLKPKLSRKTSGHLRRAQFSRAQLIIFVLAFAVIGYIIFKSFAAGSLTKTWDTDADWNSAISKSNVTVGNGSVTLTPSGSPAGAGGSGTVTIQPTTVDHTVPAKFWGYYIGDYYTQDYDLANVQQLGADLKPEVVGVRRGDYNYKSTYTPAMLHFLQALNTKLGYKPIVDLQVNAQPASFNRTDTPSNPNDVQPDGTGWSFNDLADYYKAWIDAGIDIGWFESFNEPSLKSIQDPKWWINTTADPSGGVKKSQDWAAIHQRDLYAKLKAAATAKGKTVKVPSAGNASLAPDGFSYIKADLLGTMLSAYDGTTNPYSPAANRPYIDTASIHLYPCSFNGYNPQANMNSVFHKNAAGPNWSTCDTYGITDNLRAFMDSNGYSGVPITITETSTSDSMQVADQRKAALGDVATGITIANNQKNWNIDAFTYTSFGHGSADRAAGFLQDDLSANARYYAVRDMVGPFMHNYKKQVSINVGGTGMTPATADNNSVRRINAAAGLNASGTKMGILVANIDLTNPETVTVALGTTANGQITGKRLLQSQASNSAPADIAPFGSGQSVITLAMQPGEADYLEVPVTLGSGSTYPSSGTITLTHDAGQTVDWASASPVETKPAGTNISYTYQSSPDNTNWSAPVSDITTLANSRYLKVIATLTTSDSFATPSLDKLTVAYDAVNPPATSINVAASTSAHTIDGNLNETDWNLTTSAVKVVYGTNNNSVTFGSTWDNSNLYVGVKVLDANLKNDSGSTLWDDDSVEVYVDPTNAGGTTYTTNDRQFIVGWNNDTLFEKNSNTAGVQHAWAAVSGGYTVELAIPWSNLGVTPSASMIIGLDVANNDDDDGGARDGQSVWSGTFNNFDDPSAFGKATLTGAPTSSKVGDLNNDNQVNIQDLSILLSNFNQSGIAAQGDLNGDGKVTILDLSILLSKYGS